jgi:prepilin-type N-terminal cleavage/methylation domain-containing protein
VTRPARRRGDAGFSLVELVVALAVMAVVVGLTVGFIIGLEQQQVNVDATVAGSRQAQLAAQEVVQYLRAAATPTAGAGVTETSTEAMFPAYIGSGVTGSPAPSTAELTVQYVPGTGAGSDVSGEGRLQVTFQGSKSSRVVDTFYVLAPNLSTRPPYTPIFRYESYDPNNPGQLHYMAMPAGGITQQCALSQIVAIEIDASFFAGPSDTPTRGYAVDTASTVDTTIFLRNTKSVYGSTTTTWVPPPGGCQT